jgi:adenosine/AMP kinase
MLHTVSSIFRFLGLGVVLMLVACASRSADVMTTATVEESAEPRVIDGIKPLTVEQEEQIRE